MLSVLGVSAPIPATTFDGQCDPVSELRIGLNFKVSMSSGRGAFLGHCAVSRPSDEIRSRTEGVSCGATSIPFRSNLRAE